MDLGNKLVSLREGKNISINDAAKGLKTTKQTLTKWEKGSSTPNLKKLISISEYYEVSLDELILGKEPKKEEKEENSYGKVKGICIGIIIYVLAFIWLFVSILSLNFNSILSVSIFLLLSTFGSVNIVYSILINKNKIETEYDDVLKNVENIGSIVTLLIYIFVSFVTMAWYITWIIWILFEIVIMIIKLIKYLKDKKYE